MGHTTSFLEQFRSFAFLAWHNQQLTLTLYDVYSCFNQLRLHDRTGCKSSLGVLQCCATPMSRTIGFFWTNDHRNLTWLNWLVELQTNCCDPAWLDTIAWFWKWMVENGQAVESFRSFVQAHGSCSENPMTALADPEGAPWSLPWDLRWQLSHLANSDFFWHQMIECWMRNSKALAIASNHFHKIPKCSCPGSYYF